MNRVFITEARVITALGHGLDALFTGLMEGRDGFSRVERFDTAAYVNAYAGLIPGLCIPDAGSALMDPLGKLIHETPSLDRTSLLMTASTKGGIDLLRTCSFPMSPHDRAGLPVSGLPGRLSREMGLDRPGFNISAACSSSTIALAKAADLIRSGREHTVAVLAADLVSEFVFSGFSAIGAMSPGPARPFDRNRQGLTLGEGAALVVLQNRERLDMEQRPVLAELMGWGISGDAAHLTAPARNASGLKSAITQACRTGNIPMDRIGIINTHGTGTLYNDAMELRAIHDLFCPASVMASSVKGSIGHTLGASGAIEAALCIRLLEHRMLPGTKGLKDPEDGACPIFSTENRVFEKGPVLTTNSGFGGINAALIIGEAA